VRPLWIVEWYDNGRVEMNLKRAIPKAEMVRMLRAVADGLVDGSLVHVDGPDPHTVTSSDDESAR